MPHKGYLFVVTYSKEMSPAGTTLSPYLAFAKKYLM
jgi:hypothetical protein